MRHIAIIGIGPRGLSALENLYLEISKAKKSKEIQVTLFETAATPGSGRIWNTSQPDTNWLNITERALKDLKGRPAIDLPAFTIPAFHSYTEWLPKEQQHPDEDSPDTFPPRKKLGTYLNERFESIYKILDKAQNVSKKRTEIISIELKDEIFFLTDTLGNVHQFDEVVLTIGHQPTQISEQLQQWKEHATNKTNLIVFEEPYPVEHIVNTTQINSKSTVGLRGFGLAMIDVARAITIGKGGAFKITDNRTFESEYISSDQTPHKIIPFSLDGKPMVPKPLNAAIDKWFTPTNEEIQTFAVNIRKAAHGANNVSGTDFLKNAIAPIAVRVYKDLRKKAIPNSENEEQLKQIVIKWLDNESYANKLLHPVDNDTATTIKTFIDMATGDAPISLDYCVGQVWRHCQPTLYKEFSHTDLDDETTAEVIALDERSKRYSYGPPVESMQQILTLIRAEVLVLDYVDDPEIELVADGWKLSTNSKHIITNVMINSVLDPPKLLEIVSPLISNLLSNDLIDPIHSELGIHIEKNGCIMISDKSVDIPLAALGRISKGSVIGVDAILECFGSRINDWAKSAVQRI